MKIIQIFAILILPITANLQNPYLNLRSPDFYDYSVYQGILVDSSGFYITGNFEKIGISYLQSYLTKKDFEGNTMYNTPNYFPNSSIYYSTLGPIVSKDESIIITQGSLSDTVRNGIITSYTKSTGEIVNSKILRHPLFVGNFGILRMINFGENKYLIIGIMESFPGNQDMYIAVLDKNFDIQNLHIFQGDTLNSKIPQSVILDDKKNIFIGGWVLGRYRQDYDKTSRAFIIKTDSTGRIHWKYETPDDEQWGPISDILLDENGDIYAAIDFVKEKKDTVINNIYGELRYHPGVLKFDTTERKVIWAKTIGLGNYTYYQSTVRILEATDGGGFVLAGKVDKYPRELDSFDTRGWIFKVSPDGDSLWARELQNLTEGRRTNYIQDLEPLPYGGYVGCGDAIVRYPPYGPDNPIPIQSWLFTVDEYGCLLPGCEKISNYQETFPKEVKIHMYPNPAREFLILFITGIGNNETCNMKIFNSSGKVLKQFEHVEQNVQYQLSIQDFSPGMFYISIENMKGKFTTVFQKF
ncbi:MAG: T9SS type A sorting domain-containing protein [Saprospiraceae bacterium]